MLHRDIYLRNMLLVRGEPDRMVWIDFDVAQTYAKSGPQQLARYDEEIELVEDLGKMLVKVSLFHIPGAIAC